MCHDPPRLIKRNPHTRHRRLRLANPRPVSSIGSRFAAHSLRLEPPAEAENHRKAQRVVKVLLPLLDKVMDKVVGKPVRAEARREVLQEMEESWMI